jgi:hypothetical protein
MPDLNTARLVNRSRRNISSEYLWEKLRLGVDAFVEDGPLSEHLFSSVLSFYALNADDFPTEEMRERFTKLMETMTRTPPVRDEGIFKASINAMTDEERRRVAAEIFALFIEIAERHARDHFDHEWLEGRGEGPL